MNNGVFPSEAYFSAFSTESFVTILFSNISFSLPISTDFPSTIDEIPNPVNELKSLTSNNSKFLFLASSTIAKPNGCSERYSTLAASCKRTSSDKLLNVTISVTEILPSVNVPVLSNTIVLTSLANCKASELFIKIPCSAPLPVPTIIAVGVAKPKAQGQAITSTAIIIFREKLQDTSPTKYHKIPAISAKTITIGTNTPEILSASFAIGALEF